MVATEFCAPRPLRADVVELKNGQRVEGLLKQADQSTVIVEVGGQTVTFKADQVKAIYYGTAPLPLFERLRICNPS